MIKIKGQLLSTDGPGCFFKVEEDAIGDYTVQLFSHLRDGQKLSLADYNEDEEVDTAVVGSMKKVLLWLDARTDY